MALFRKDVILTGDGVYQPVNLWIDAAACMIVFSFLASQLYMEKIPLYAALLFTLLTGAILIYKKVKYGKLGRPFIQLSPTELIMYLPRDSRGKVRFSLQHLSEIQIYGRVKRRKYRFLRHDGTYVDLAPMFEEKIEQAAIQFLTTSLPPQIAVKIGEPQTFFEEVRGEGP